MIAFGGSYGGMLAGWMRMHFPHVIQGAVAGSAPVRYFKDMVKLDGFFQTCTETFKKTTPEGHCNKIIKEAFEVFSFANKNEKVTANFATLKTNLNLCEAPKSGDDVMKVYNFIAGGLQYMAVTDYPTPADFLENMPANPVNYACDLVADKMLNTTPNKGSAIDKDQIKSLKNLKLVSDVYFDYKPKTEGEEAAKPFCYDWNTDPTGNLGDGQGWNALACNEVVMPMGTLDDSTMFLEAPWNYDDYAKTCLKDFGLVPQY